MVCRQLGFKRGVRSTTQGFVHGPVDPDEKITEEIGCQGYETRLERCNIAFSSGRRSGGGQQNSLRDSIISVTCIHDSHALCEGDDEIPWRGSCYSLFYDKATFKEANKACESRGRSLVEISDQEENDLISELLLGNRFADGRLSKVWTGGLANRRARSSLFYWAGSRTRILGKYLKAIRQLSFVLEKKT